MIGFSVSPYTETFWNEFLINPKSCEYNLVVDQAINGPLDIARLENAIAKLVEENILFSHVRSDSGDQLRWVPGNKSIILEQLDPSCDLSARVKAPFDLRSGPLCRFLLVRHDAHHHDLIVILHHTYMNASRLQGFRSFDIDGRLQIYIRPYCSQCCGPLCNTLTRALFLRRALSSSHDPGLASPGLTCRCHHYGCPRNLSASTLL